MKRSRAETAKIKWDLLNLWLKRPEISDNELAQMYNLDNHTVAKYRKEWHTIFDDWQRIIEGKVIERVEQVEKKTGVWKAIWEQMTGQK